MQSNRALVWYCNQSLFALMPLTGVLLKHDARHELVVSMRMCESSSTESKEPSRLSCQVDTHSVRRLGWIRPVNSVVGLAAFGHM